MEGDEKTLTLPGAREEEKKYVHMFCLDIIKEAGRNSSKRHILEQRGGAAGNESVEVVQ